MTEKIKAMVTNLGYPNFVLNTTELDESAADVKASLRGAAGRAKFSRKIREFLLLWKYS